MFSNGQRLARETGRHGGQISDTVTRSHGRSFWRLRCEERGDRGVLNEDHEGRRSLQKIGLGELIYLELLRESTVIGKNYFVKVVLSKLFIPVQSSVKNTSLRDLRLRHTLSPRSSHLRRRKLLP